MRWPRRFFAAVARSYLAPCMGKRACIRPTVASCRSLRVGIMFASFRRSFPRRCRKRALGSPIWMDSPSLRGRVSSGLCSWGSPSRRLSPTQTIFPSWASIIWLGIWSLRKWRGRAMETSGAMISRLPMSDLSCLAAIRLFTASASRVCLCC